MEVNTKSTKDAPQPENPQLTASAAFVNLLQKGVERLADVQKSGLEIYAQQTADAINAWKRVMPGAPGALLADAAGQGIGRFVEMQKNMLDIMVQQSGTFLSSMNERAPGKVQGKVPDLVRDTAEASVAAHKIALDFTAQQNKALIDTQKEILEMASKPLK